MKKMFCIAAFCLLVSSCSHSGFMVGQGRVLHLNGSGLTYVNGIFASDFSRENAETEVEVSDTDAIGKDIDTSQQMKGEFKVKRKIGKIVSGYLVELSKVNPKAVQEYLKGIPQESKKQ